MAIYTVTRALAENKTTVSKFEKKLQDLNLVAVKVGNKLISPYTSFKEEDFTEKAKAELQSIFDLHKRIIAIKNAIDLSNSKTKIVVGGKEMTISEALIEKRNIDLKKDLLKELKKISTSSKRDFESEIDKNNSAIERMITGAIGKDVSDAQRVQARKDAEEFIEKTKSVSMIDPCKIDDVIKSLEEEITEFETNIDYALSESNSTTTIEVPD